MKSGPSCLSGVAAALFALLPSCAPAPPKAVTEGEEALLVSAGTWMSVPGPSALGPLTNKLLIAVEGAQCTLQNDKGTWTATTPHTVRVQRSAKPLVADCTKEGYRPAHFEGGCHSPRTLGTQHPAILIPLGIVLAPLAPMSLAVVGGAAHDISLGKDADLCTYGIDGTLVLMLEPR